MYILGINAFHGDASAALLKDGVLVCALEEERLNRVKHCAGFPSLAVAACLREAGIGPGDLDHVAIGRDPSANLMSKILFTRLRRPGVDQIVKSRLQNAAKVRDVSEILCRALGVPRTTLRAPVHNVEHHRAHLASTFFASGFEDAALLTLDGFGDFVSTMRAVGHGTKFQVLDQVEFPHSLGILYTAVTQWLGFPKYGDEGKVMGLAPYGRAVHLQKLLGILKLSDDGLFELDLDYFRHHAEGVSMNWEEGSPTLGRVYSDKVCELLGPAREPGSPLTSYHEDIAASLQAALEEGYWHLLAGLHEKTGLDRLCLAGGVALNSVANGKALRRSPFKDVFVQPAAGDNGTSLGAALYVWHQVLGKPRGYVMEHAQVGLAFDRAACQATAAGLTYTVPADEDAPCTETARALDARIKHREAFRPFAPSILAETTGDWFTETHPSPCMLMVYPVRPEKRKQVPAITHVDGSGRLQTVERPTHPRYWKLVKAFETETGVPIVLNTSFDENEPIVGPPADAVASFAKTNMDVLVLGDLFIRRADQPGARPLAGGGHALA